MSDLLCDATTSSGRPCKNFSVGAVNGRNFCNVVSHQEQAQKYQRIRTSHTVDNAPDSTDEADVVAAALSESVVEESAAAVDTEVATSVETLVETEVVTEVEQPVEPSAVDERAAALLEEARGWVALASQVCPGCGTAGKPSFWGVLSDAPDTKLICIACETRWTMSGARWRA